MGVARLVASLENKLAAFTYADQKGWMLSRFRLMDFGTRRRFLSRGSSRPSLNVCSRSRGSVGTSNYDLARRLNLTPMGTQAHGSSRRISKSARIWLTASARPRRMAEGVPNQLLDRPPTALRWMPSCVTSVPLVCWERYQGLRHDSGDPG